MPYRMTQPKSITAIELHMDQLPATTNHPLVLLDAAARAETVSNKRAEVCRRIALTNPATLLAAGVEL